MDSKPKFSPTAWFLLGFAAATIDLIQIGVDTFGAALAGIGEIPAQIVNVFIDIVVGLSLFLLFFLKGMLDWKLTASILLGFLADFFTLGIFPAWTADIGYAWLITDGAKTLGAIPVVGGAARAAAVAGLSGGKSGVRGTTGATPPVIPPSGLRMPATEGAVPPRIGSIPPPLPRTSIPSPAPKQTANGNELDLRGENGRKNTTFSQDYAETQKKYDRIRALGKS